MKRILFTLMMISGMLIGTKAQVIYSEDFTGQNGKGALCACTGVACSTCNSCDLTGVTWDYSTQFGNQGSFHDCIVGGMYFRVIDEQMQNTWTGNGNPCWVSPVIDVSALSTIEIKIGQVKNCGTVAMNFSQRLRVYGVRDGTNSLFHEYFGFDFPAGHSVSYTDVPINVVGINDFQVMICLHNSGNSQRIWCYDDVTVEVVVLLVELTEFTGEANETSVKLNWITASEKNNNGFEIERSSSGEIWETIGWVEGNGTTDERSVYNYIDHQPKAGLNYYRLKQIDFDDAYEHSDVVAVNFEDPNQKVTIYPNPTTVARRINVKIDNPSEERVQLSVHNNLGVKIWDNNWAEGAVSWIEEIEIKESGVYYVTAQVGAEVYYEKVMVTGK